MEQLRIARSAGSGVGVVVGWGVGGEERDGVEVGVGWSFC